MEIKQMMQQFYGQQVNAGMLSVHDIAKAEMQDSYAAYIGTLEGAWNAVNENAKQVEQIKSEEAQKEREFQLQLAQENREDIQKHETDMQLLIGDIKKEIEMMKATYKQGQILTQAEEKRKEIELQNQQQPNNV
jgi:hypothetical protein